MLITKCVPRKLRLLPAHRTEINYYIRSKCVTCSGQYNRRTQLKKETRLYHIIRRDHVSEDVQRQIDGLSGLPIVHHEGYVCPLSPGHRFKMMKFHYLYEILVKDGVIDQDKQVIKPERISRQVASCVHSESYVSKFFDGQTSREEQRATGFDWTPGLASRVRYETGGTLLAGQLCLERGLACSTGGGTHHAFPDRGSGYCLINDLAVTAQHLVNTSLAHKVLIVDLDVHQGDGTAFMFQNCPDVFTLSLHCQKNFPFRKQKSDLDVGLEIGTDDMEYMRILSEYIPGVIDRVRPDMILYDAGVDPHKEDQLGKLRLTDDGLYQRDMLVLKSAICRGVPVATVIGGGYDDIMKLSARHTIIHRVAQQVWHNYL